MAFDWGCAPGHALPLRRELVIPVAVFGLNLPIPPVDQQLSALVLGNLPRPVDGIRLAVEELRGALGAGTLNSPPVFSGDDVLVAFRHVDHLCHSGMLLICMCGKQSKRGQNTDNVRGGKKLRT